MRNLKSTIFLLSIIFFAIGCSKDDSIETTPTIILSSDKQITSLQFLTTDNPVLSKHITTTISESAGTITSSLEEGIDLTALLPSIKIAPKSSISPTGVQDFTNPVTYTVTAEDGSKNTYIVTLSITDSKSGDNQIIGFKFLVSENSVLASDLDATIDESGKTINATVPYGTNITALLPKIEIPQNAMVDPSGPQDFTAPITYTITAEDGTSTSYDITITANLTQKDILTLIYNSNPGNTLSWDLNEPDVSKWNNVHTDTNGNIVELYIAANNLTSIPPEIGKLTALQNLSMTFNNLIEVPQELGQLTNLKRLSIANNKLTSIPPEIGKLHNLEELNLWENNLVSLPLEIYGLSNLKNLALMNNYFESIPTEIAQLNNLQSLNMDNNTLTSIPKEIGQLYNLITLSMADNNLTVVPSEIGQLSKLQYLYLYNNDLTTLPKAICDLPLSVEIQVDEDVTCVE